MFKDGRKTVQMLCFHHGQYGSRAYCNIRGHSHMNNIHMNNIHMNKINMSKILMTAKQVKKAKDRAAD